MSNALLEFIAQFPVLYPLFTIVNYILGIVGVSLIIYTFSIFFTVIKSLIRTKDINTIKIIHILSAVEVYAFICFLIGIALVSKIFGLIFLKLILFGIIVIFNGITVTRLVAKTSYFYNMHSKNKS